MQGAWNHAGSQKLHFSCFSQTFFFFLRHAETLPIAFWVTYWSISWRSVWPEGAGGVPLCRSSVGRLSCSSWWPCSRNSALWFASTWKHLSGWSVTPRRKLSGANTESLIRNPINTDQGACQQRDNIVQCVGFHYSAFYPPQFIMVNQMYDETWSSFRFSTC